MATTNSCGEADLGPRRVGIHFRKLACRSDAVDEVLGWRDVQDFGARARSTGPPHEGYVAHPGRLSGRTRRIAGRANLFATRSSELEGQVNGRAVSHTADEEPAPQSPTSRSNKRMQLTKLTAAPVWQAEVPPCAPAGCTDGGTASQLIRSVRPTFPSARRVNEGDRVG